MFGLFFAHVALSHRDLDEKGAKGLHRFACAGWPFLQRLPARWFKRGMVAAEAAVAVTLLAPFVPPVIGAAGLVGFGSGLLGVYARMPGMRRSERSVRPSDFGLSLAKDAWMVAAGTTVLVDAAVATAAAGRARRSSERR